MSLHECTSERHGQTERISMIEADNQSCKHNFLRFNIAVTQLIICMKRKIVDYHWLREMQVTGNTMQKKGNSWSEQITTISEVSTRKLQDMPTIIQGITKTAEVDPTCSEDSRRSFEDIQWFPKITRRRFFSKTCLRILYASAWIIMIGHLAFFHEYCY